MQNPTSNSIFTYPIWLQSHSNEIVVYCSILGQCVKIAWPTTNGERIEPTGLRSWLRRRGLHWSCFCPLETGEPLSCQIVHGKNNGRVIAHCGQFPSHCGFRLDLTRIFHEALLFSNYPNIPIQPGAYPDMENILSVYLRDTTLEDLPYIVGYGGEFCDGIFQQAGSRLVPDSSWSFLDMEHVRRRRRDALDRNAASYQADDAARQNAARRPSSAAYTRVRRSTSSNAIAGPSNQPGNGEIPGRGHGDSGSPMATGSLITTLWGLWRSVLAVVVIFLAAFLVLMSLLAPDDI